jgi:hypothetical protein
LHGRKRGEVPALPARISAIPVTGYRQGEQIAGRLSLHAAVYLLEIYKSIMNQYVKTVK